MLNLITDVAGIRVGNASDASLKSGVTVILCDEPAIASVHVMGGAPGTRETDVLATENTVERIDAVVLSGGSAFGLDAAGGVMDGLRASGRGFAVGPVRVPIVPAAVLFDLANGGDKDWGDQSPYRRLGRAALDSAARKFSLGSVGAGTGATLATLKGGLGSASAKLENGVTVGAIAAVNAVGEATIGDGPHFWASHFEVGSEFGGRGAPPPGAGTPIRHKLQGRIRANTTLAVVATDAALGKAQAKRLAMVSHNGLARALWPVHTPFDGDLVFTLATGRVPLADPALAMIEIGAAATACVARAIARAVYAATPAPGDLVPTWHERFGAQPAG